MKLSPLRERRTVLLALLIITSVAFALGWISTGFTSFFGWFSFLTVFVLAGLLVWLARRVLRPENPPRWLFVLVLGAIGLRLVLGVVWFLALPAGGYDTEVQNAGYVMEDAFNRDKAAWQLAESQQPLWSAFQGFSSSDQYGGLLFMSAAVYRYLGTGEHQPLLVLVLAAAVSGIAVAFTWAFARRAWGEKVAWLAAWGIALYPEAVLLGSSQMREAFTVALVPMALYGLQRVRENLDLSSMSILLLPILISIPISWPFTSSLILFLIIVYLGLNEWDLLRKRWVLISLALILVLSIFYFVFLVDINTLWLVQSADWQAYVNANASDWVDRQFGRMPVWGQVPFVVIYGIFRPLLPAALVAGGPPIWASIGVWRALGWTALLALLLYATYLAFRTQQWKRLPGVLLLSTWIVSFTASYRGGGDLWDSPRYRSAFAGIQVAVAAWAWVKHMEIRDSWLRRAVGGTLLVIAWFIPWYLRRYASFDWPIIELHQVLGLGLASASLYAIWDWIGT